MRGSKTGNELVHNVFTAETTIKGNITSQCDMRIDGDVEGDIVCQGKVIVGKTGRVVGSIVSQNLEILGEVSGSIQVADFLSLKSSATFAGNIVTKRLVIEVDATLLGNCTIQMQRN